jgi:hypothetical protein
MGNPAVSWRKPNKKLLSAIVIALIVAAVPLLSAAAPSSGGRDSLTLKHLLPRLSSTAALDYWIFHLQQAPAPLRSRIARLHGLLGTKASNVFIQQGSVARTSITGAPAPFNRDFTGLPQNEESVTSCGRHGQVVLSSTNDYRGLLTRQFDFTGWELSTDGGTSIHNEGLLPAIPRPRGRALPSQGDPVVVSGPRCRMFAADLNFAPFGLQGSGIGVYRSSASTLSSCLGGSNALCWPRKKLVAIAPRQGFDDKPWMDVGASGQAGEVVWVVFTAFPDVFGPVSVIEAVRCGPHLRHCTAPIHLSRRAPRKPPYPYSQFPYVTVGPDGRTYATWSQIRGGYQSHPDATYVQKLRVAPPGSTHFGPTRVIARVKDPLSNPNPLVADSFRASTQMKNTVALVNGRPRVFAVWERCRPAPRLPAGPFPGPRPCEDPVIVMRSSDDKGASWSKRTILSKGGTNYFPTIASNQQGAVVVAWYTNRFDPFEHRQDIELVRVDPSTDRVVLRRRLTPLSNEPDADPFLAGFFIGDYIQIHLQGRTAYVGYNANYRSVRLLGKGPPVHQQDNFITKTRI